MDRTCRFRIAPCPPEQVQLLQRDLCVSGPVAQALVRRGLAEPERARAFLAAEEEHPPEAFAGIDAALATILGHVRAGARITVHGDYDVDGVCSTAVLVRVLRALGANLDWYLPDRATDGYGLNPVTVRRLAERGTRLLVTVDCAITAVAEVRLARSLGLDVVVTDHHTPRADGTLPDAAIVHPAVCGYPCADLCATAVAYKLAQALWRAACSGQAVDGYQGPEDDLDLVALATIADVVPLRGENRTLVRRGLRALAGTGKPGLRALMAVARVAGGGGIGGSVAERAVGFALAPRLNAAGRLYRADAGLELILTADADRAKAIAAELDRANHERRRAELRILSEAEQLLVAVGERAGYVLAGEDWHAGVIGIVASRLVERHHRPFVLVALDGPAGRGSGRAIERFDLLGALDACGGHLLRYGGHRAAAGLEVSRERLTDFGEAFAAHAEQVLGSGRVIREERVDAIVRGEDLGMGLAEELQQLAPFGAGNPTVSLLLRGAVFADRQPMGEGRHVRFTLHHGQSSARAVAFGGGTSLPVPDGEPADATFALEVNEWRGVSEPRLVLRHAQPAVSVPASSASLTQAEPPRHARPAASVLDADAAQEDELVLF
ncbi:MAG TPA: single-stranded-DNA-specific exonuclease RecJ [Solirubrobacteraceae bacterium]|nr:single-stranded-DNA-specific exonuclease RecJ [Solirubrobacteraceae bacterium]